MIRFLKTFESGAERHNHMETNPILSKQERRELKRKIKEGKRTSFERSQFFRKFIGWVLVLAVIGVPGWFIYREITKPRPGIKVPLQSRDHVKPGEKHDAYNSNPPTSGPHYPNWAEWGISDKALPVEFVIHNMEHGGVIIFYNCEKCDDLVKNLKTLTEELRKDYPKIILTPNKDIDAKIAIASWGWYEKYQNFEPEKIRAFVDAHYDHAPEKVM